MAFEHFFRNEVSKFTFGTSHSRFPDFLLIERQPVKFSKNAVLRFDEEHDKCLKMFQLAGQHNININLQKCGFGLT